MFWRAKYKFGPNFKDALRKAKTILPLVFVLLAFIFIEKASAIPNSINYQARLRDNLGVPISTSTTIQFSIYNHLSGGSSGDTPSAGGPLLWKETYDQASGACSQIIPDAQGYFTLTLGDCTAFPSYLDFSSGTYYLGVKISSDSESAPRVKLNAHPYALNSDRVDGFHATSTATAGQLLALGDDLSFDIGAGVYSGASINLTSTTATSSIAGNLNVIGNATFATATIDNLIISGASSFTDISWSNATGTNLYLASNLTVVGDSYFGTIASGTWNGSVIGSSYGGTGQDTSGWSGLIRLTAGVWSTTTIDLTGDVNGILPIANGGTNASSFSPYEFVWFNGSSLIGSGFSSTSFMATSTDNWVDITGDTMTGPLVINSDLTVSNTSTLATTTISTLRLGDYYGLPTDAPVLISYKQYTDLSLFEFFPVHTFMVDLLPTTDSSSTVNSMISLTTNENSITNFDLTAGTFSQVVHNGSGVVDAAVGTLSIAELASATGSINFAVGMAGQVNNGIENPAFSGSINNAVAVLAMIENGMGGGAISSAAGLMTDITIDGGVINNAYGARINNPTTNSASGTIENLYGLYIEEQNFGSTSNFNIYSDGTSSVNYFGGRIGIGTTTPAYDLHLVQDRNLNAPAITFENTNSTGVSSTMILNLKVGNYGGGIAVAGENFDDWGLSNIAGYTILASAIEQSTDGNGIAMLAGSSGNIIFYAGGFGPPTMDTERMRIENDGRVAIGTSSTYEMLTVAGGINIGATTTPTSTAGTIAFDGTDFIGYTGSSWLSLTAGIGGVTGSGSIGQLSFWDSTSSITGTSSLFWDDATGYLGIGTSTPASIFYTVEDNDFWTMAQVHNLNTGPSSTAALLVRVGENWGGGLFQASPNYSDFDLANLAGYTVLLSGAPDIQSNGLAIGATGDGNIIFYAGGGGPPTADTERMRIEASGLVGIGTSSPLSKLDVYGDLVLSGVDRYLNFNTATGSDGYGIRDYNGKVQFKHSDGSWADIYGKVNHTINVAQEGGDFDNLNDAVDYANSVSYDVIIQIYPGEYTVSSTLEITNPYIKGIHGMSQSAVMIQPTSSMASAGDPIFDFNFSTDTVQFAMSDFTIDGSNEPSFKSTAGCAAIQVSSEGVNWIEMERMYIADVNRGIDLSVANLVDAFHVDFYNMGNAGVYIDNGGVLQIEASYMEESDTYYAYIDSTTGASELYMVGSEFGSYNNSGTGLYIAGDDSYAEIRYSNMWGLDNNIVSNNSSVTKVTASYLQEALTLNIDQNDDSTINISSSDGAFSSTDISINNPDNVYFYALAEEEGTVLFGRHDNIDQDIIKVDTGQSLLPKLAYRSDYYGNSGILFINDNASEQTMLGVQATSSWAKLSAMSGDRDAGSALFLYSDTDDFGTTSSLRGWAIARSGGQANLVFAFQNNDTGDGKSNITDNKVMELDGFNTQMLVKGGAVFNTSSGAYNFIARGDNDDNLLFVQGSTDLVGIGTSTPGYKLTVAGDINITGNYRVNGIILAPVNYGTLAGQTLYWTGSAWAPTSSLFMASSGFVGIGTTTPLNALSVVGGINLVSGTPANTAYALYNNAGQLYWNGMPVVGGSTSTFIQDADGDTVVSVESSPDEDWIRFTTAGTERMVITNEGIIGIGTSTPGMADPLSYHILDIEFSSNTDSGIRLANLSAGNGASTEMQFFNDAGYGGTVVLAGSNFDGFPNAGNMFGLAATAGNDVFLTSLGGDIKLMTMNNLINGSSSLFIQGSGATEGYVGINTSSPLSQLDVYGNIILSAVDPYINFGSTTASSGYGFRVNNGLVEVKHLNNNHNVWSEIVTLVALTEGNTIYVNGASGKDSFDGTSPAKAKKTITAGLSAASVLASSTNPYSVAVSAGTYVENISMPNYIKLQGAGCNTIINGKVTFNMSYGSVLSQVHVMNTDDYAVVVTGAGQAMLKHTTIESTYSNDASIQGALYQNNGVLDATESNEFKLTRSDNSAGVRINTALYFTGSNLVRAYIFGSESTITTSDGTDDLSLVYVDNTNSGSVITVKDPVVTFPIYSFAPANAIKLVYHNGASANTYLDAGFVTGVTISAGSVKVFPAYIANSGVDSGARITHTSFSWAGAGITDDNVFLGASVSSTDKIVLVSNHFNTVADVFPVRYDTAGASGTLDYFVANGHGNLQNTSFSTYDGSFGIGTSTPYDRLEIWGDDLSSSPTSSRNYITIVANGNGEAGHYIRRVNSGSYDNGWSWYMPTSSMDFRLWDDSVGAEGDDVFTIQAGTGHVGIGTALYEPLNLLHVDGGIYLGDTATATSTYSIYNVGGDLYWNGNLLASAGGATANWILANHNGGDALSTSTTIPVWFKDVIFASSSLYVDGNSFLATTTMTNASANYLVVNNTVTTTDLVATGYITLGGVARNTWPSGGGGDSSWATTSANVLYPSLTPPYAVVIGGSVTSSNAIFEVVGDSYMSGDLHVGGSLTIDENFQADYFTAVSTTAISYLGGGMVLGDPNATGITGYERIILSDDIGAFSDFSFKVAGGGYPVLNLGSSNGTTVAPTLKGSGNYGGLDFYGYDGANWQKSGGILGQSDGTPALNSMPGKIVFSTTPNGSTTALDRMAIDSRGWVGMGTTTPSAPLHVVTATSGPAMTILQKTIAGATNLNFVTNNNRYWQLSKRDATQDDKFIFYYVNDSGLFTNILTLGATGTVGINNENPNAMLTISGTSTYPLLNVMTSSSATGMYISNIGNVGIGTTDPNYYKLRVYEEDSDVSAEVKTASSSKVALFNLKAGGDTNVLQLGYYGSTTPGFAGIPPDSAVFDAVAPGGAYIINEASGAPIVFMTDGWQASNERMRITSEGYVGIGTKTPSTTLSVNGTSTMKNVVPASSLIYDLGNFERNWNKVWTTSLNINNQNSLAAIESTASFGPTSTSINGSLDITDPDNPNRTGRYMDSYNIATLFSGIPNGSAMTVSITSGVIDTYLQIVSDTGSVTYFDDDGGTGTNSYLAFNYDASSTYNIVVTSYGAGETGAYTLDVTAVNSPVDAGLAFYSSISGNGNNLFTILNSGNVGIGTSSPNSVLTIYSDQEEMVSIISSSTGQTLLEAKNLSQNFGMSLETGALIQRNAYFGEEFMRNRANITADTLYAWGDFQQFNTDENTACTWSIINNEVNGVGRQQASAGNSCLSYYGSALGTAHSVFNANNLPVILSKIRPSADSATARFWVGIGDRAQAQTTDPTNGIYFTNNTATGDWRGITRRAGASTNVECTGQTVNNAVFAITKIEVVSSNGDGTGSVKFYIDNDTSNGIDWTYCGESTTNIPTVGLTALLMNYSTALHSLDIDFWRVWQDDSSAPPTPIVLTFEEEEEITEDLTIEERVVILEEFDTNITDDFELITESVDVLDVSLSETQAMLDELSGRVSILENNDILADQSIVDLSNMMTDFDLRLSELASSSAGLQLIDEVFESLTANILVIYDSAIFNGTLTAKKHVTFGEDTVGQGMILAGHASTTVIFAEPYEIAPIINITPIDFDGKWKLSEVSTSGFKIMLSEIQSVDVLFNWQAIGASTDSKVFVSDGTVNLIGLQIDYVPEPVPEEPVIEEPSSEEPVVEEPVVEEPVVEEPTPIEEPATEDEPIVEEPVTEESPITEEPVVEDPISEEPAPTEEPIVEEPVAEEPVVEEPTPAEEPVAEPPAEPLIE